MTATPVSAPSITSIAFDKTSYTAGSTITATVTYVRGTRQTGPSVPQPLIGTAPDQAPGQTGQLSQTFTVGAAGATVQDSTTPTVSDSGGRTWTKTSDTGTVAVFTATA